MVLKVNDRELRIRTESEIVEAARNGDVDSFGELYERYYAVMVWLAYSVLLDHNLAEDAAQQTFALACEKLVRLKQPEKFTSWLAAICRNIACRMARQRKGRALPDDLPAVAEKGHNDDLNKMVKEAIGNLPGMYRQIVLLHYYNDMSYEQMALVLGVSIHKVKGRLFRARRKIAKYLKDKGLNEEDRL